MLIKYIYTFFLAVLVVTFVGVGIAAFYKSPKMPEYPIGLSYPAMEEKSTESAAIRTQQIKYEKQQRDFQNKNEAYSKNVSTISVIGALLILILSITLLSKIDFISDGLLLGGVFTLGYAIIRGFGAGDEIFRFIVVTIGLATALFLGYWRFVRNLKPSKKTSSK